MLAKQPKHDAARTAGRRGDRTRERILDAAESLFAERGYAGATLRDVAARVGVRNPSLYNHFDNKESLYDAVLERVTEPVLAALEAYAREGSDAYRNSRQIVEQTISLLASHPNLARLVLHETLAGGPHLSRILRDRIGPLFALAHEGVVQRAPAGRWSSRQIQLLVLAMYHIVVGYFVTAPLYEELDGMSLGDAASLAEQTEVVCRIVDALFADDDS